jgi:hypothetical protein
MKHWSGVKKRRRKVADAVARLIANALGIDTRHH